VKSIYNKYLVATDPEYLKAFDRFCDEVRKMFEFAKKHDLNFREVSAAMTMATTANEAEFVLTRASEMRKDEETQRTAELLKQHLGNGGKQEDIEIKQGRVLLNGKIIGQQG